MSTEQRTALPKGKRAVRAEIADKPVTLTRRTVYRFTVFRIMGEWCEASRHERRTNATRSAPAIAVEAVHLDGTATDARVTAVRVTYTGDREHIAEYLADVPGTIEYTDTGAVRYCEF